MLSPRLLLPVLACAVLPFATPAPAHGAIANAATLDGPSADVLELGGVAMADDGTGGVVWRRRIGDVPHIFAAQFVDGRWRSPQRIDAGQRFASSWPAVGAANGGQLVVTWVQEAGPRSDRLFSATLGRGARRFQAPVLVDGNVGEAIATFPSLAMNAGGNAYLAYRVVTSTESNAGLPPGYVDAEVRLARFGGQYWSSFGFPLDRNPSVPVREPTAANSPKVAIDQTGSGLLAFQEPDEEFVDRIYARRLFGATNGVTLPVSPQRIGDRPLRGPADAFTVDMAGFGQGAVAFRQQPGEDSPLRGTRIMLATLPEAFAEKARDFTPPRIVDGAGEGGPSAAVGVPSTAIAPRGQFLTGFSIGTASLTTGGDEVAVGAVERADDGASADPGDPVVDLARGGTAAAAAFRTRSGGRGGVVLQERRTDGVPEARLLSGTRGGQVGPLQLAGSGLGDAAVAWLQGSGALAQIVVAAIDAPPAEFAASTPADFVATDQVEVTWDESASAVSPVTYAVTVDGEEAVTGLKALKATLPRTAVDDGVHEVQVIAEDRAGQETTSLAAELKVDRTAPRPTVRRRRDRRVELRIRDGAGASGTGGSSVRWGDGTGANVEGEGILRHRYRRPGRYAIRIGTTDLAGNARRATLRVRVR